MLGYIMVGTNDLKKAATFFDTLFAELGGSRDMDEENFIAWKSSMSPGSFCVTQPYDGNPATVGNGTMMGFYAPSPEMVDKLYAMAIEMGATDEGAPGPRPEYSEDFYAGYFRDLDGNKMNFFHFPFE